MCLFSMLRKVYAVTIFMLLKPRIDSWNGRKGIIGNVLQHYEHIYLDQT